jgi:CBS domain-containing protein
MSLRARDVMKTEVKVVDPDMSLVDFERLLLQQRIGGAPVVKKGELLGMVSRSDIIRVLSLEQSMAEVQSGAYQRQAYDVQRRAVELIGDQVGRRMQELKVKNAMTEVRARVSPDAPIIDVAKLMMEHRIHRVLVVEGSALKGVISRIDLVALIADGRMAEPKP